MTMKEFDVKIKDAKIITVELTINIPIYGSETDSEEFRSDKDRK